MHYYFIYFIFGAGNNSGKEMRENVKVVCKSRLVGARESPRTIIKL